jgi:hypothetical protein
MLLVASGNRVLFSSSLYGSDVSLWYIGQAVRKICSPSWDTSSFSLRGFIFHPTDQERLYVFYQPPGREGELPFDTSLCIQEFLRGTPEKSWFQPFVPTASRKSKNFKRWTRFTIAAMDDEGLVSIRSLGGYIPCDEEGECIQRPPCDHDDRDLSCRWFFTSFNILTGEFTTHANHLWETHSQDDTFDESLYLIWRDQTILSQGNMYDMRRLVALNSCGTQHRHVSPNLEKASIGLNYKRTGTAFIFDDSDGNPDPYEYGSNEDTVESHWGDDDFIVWGNTKGYIVWSFDETITLPKRWTHNIGP